MYFTFVLYSLTINEYKAFEIIKKQTSYADTNILKENLILPRTLEDVLSYEFSQEKFYDSYLIATRLLSLDNSSAQASYAISIYKNKQKDLTGAKKFMKQALDFDPNNSLYLVSMGLLEYFDRNNEMANLYLEKAREVNPSQSGISRLSELLSEYP